MSTVEIIKIKHEARCLLYAGYKYTLTGAEEGPRTETFCVIITNAHIYLLNNRTFEFGCSNVVLMLYSQQKLLVPSYSLSFKLFPIMLLF